MSELAGLSAEDRRILDTLLQREADPAFRRRVRRLLDFLELVDGERVLDCGCGMGFYGEAIGRLRRITVVGVDVDAVRLREAAERRTAGSFARSDIERLPFGNHVFDKVLMTEVLEHLLSDRAGLAEAYRVLRSGGLLAISVPHARYPFWWDPINRTWAAVGGRPIRRGPIVGIWTGHERLYEPDDLAQRVAHAGFRVEVVEEATHYAAPFSHFLLYGVGKPLLESGWLPASVRAGVDRRMSGTPERPSPLSPLGLGLRILQWADRFNELPQASDKRSFVNVLIKARKP